MSDNEKPEEGTREVPIVEEDFATLMGKFRIKPEVATNISNNISHTGGQTVFENPELLTKKLAAWSTEVSPAKRKLIIEQWFAERGIEVPEEVIERAGKGPDELKKDAKVKEGTENIYYVEADTAIIRLAAGNEKATTLSEAKELQRIIKKDLKEARKSQEAEDSGKPPAFVQGEQGAWTLNPQAKIGFGEFAVFQMYQDSLRRGEPIDPVEELTKRAEQSARLKEAMGVKPGGEDAEMTTLDKLEKLGMLKKGEGEGGLIATLDSLGLLRKSGEEGSSTQLDTLDKLDKLGMLKKGEGEGGLIATLDSLGVLKKSGEEGSSTQIDTLDKLDKLGMLKKGEGEGTLLAQLDSLGLLRKSGEEGKSNQMDVLEKLDQMGMLKKPGEEGAESQTMRALETEVKQLRESMQKQEMDVIRNAVASLANSVDNLRKEMSTQGRLEGRYALMDKTITAIDSQLSGFRSDVKPLVMAATGGTSEPRKKSPEEKAKIARGLKEAVELEKEAHALEDELLFVGRQG